jgi:YVTN family beta-propeller protein
MKFAPLLLFGVVAWASAQDRVAVTFKVFPQDYDVFAQGERLTFAERSDGLRTYSLPSGSTRVSVTAPLSAPQGLSLEVKPGLTVQTKLEPRQGPLSLVGETATGKGPRSIAFSADGKRLFVALQGESGTDVYDIPSLKKTGRLAAPDASGGMSDVLAVGTEIWVVGLDGSVQAFDAATLAYKNSVTLGTGGNAFLADRGGPTALVNWDSGQLFAVDGARKPTGSITLSGSVRGFSFFQGTAYASLFDRGQIAVIDASWKVKTLWRVGHAPRPVAAVSGRLFVGDMANASVLIVDTATGKTVNTVTVASNPHQMTVSKDQSLVAVASRGKNNPNDYQLAGPEFGKVTVFLASGAVAGSVWGRNQPTGLAFSPDGKYLAFTDFLDNNLELYRVAVKAPR